MGYAVLGQLVKGLVSAIALAVCASCSVSEFDDQLGPPAFYLNPVRGLDAETDELEMQNHASTVATNEHGTLEAPLGDGIDFVDVPKGEASMGTDECDRP